MSDRLITDIRPTMDDVLLTPRELAARWHIGVAALATMRAKGKGPRYYKLSSGAIRYPDWAVFDAEIGK